MNQLMGEDIVHASLGVYSVFTQYHLNRRNLRSPEILSNVMSKNHSVTVNVIYTYVQNEVNIVHCALVNTVH